MKNEKKKQKNSPMLKSSKILTVLNSKPFALWAVVKITSMRKKKKKK